VTKAYKEDPHWFRVDQISGVIEEVREGAYSPWARTSGVLDCMGQGFCIGCVSDGGCVGLGQSACQVGGGQRDIHI